MVEPYLPILYLFKVVKSITQRVPSWPCGLEIKTIVIKGVECSAIFPIPIWPKLLEEWLYSSDQCYLPQKPIGFDTS